MNIDEQRTAFEVFVNNPLMILKNLDPTSSKTYQEAITEFAWKAWLASANREGYKLVPVSFLKDINSVAVDEFHKWKIKEEQMPAICEYMQDLSFYMGVEK